LRARWRRAPATLCCGRPCSRLQSIHASITCVERISDAEALALEALPAARRARTDVERLVLQALAWARALRGRPSDDLRQRHGTVGPIDRSLERVEGVRLMWRGDAARARALLASLLALADERGETWSYLVARLHVCELELRAGGWEAASRVLDEWTESSDSSQFQGLVYERCRALLAAGRGDPVEAERRAAEAIAGAESTGVRWQLLEALRARGIAALLAHEPQRASESLRAVWHITEREGVEEPGAFPVAPDLVEALMGIGEPEEAARVTRRLYELAAAQDHPWGLVTATRCRAMVDLASSSRCDAAAAALSDAADGYERLGLPFDRARAQLVLGRAARRLRKWGTARRALEPAAAAFDAIGSPGWADEARTELARVGGRRAPPPGELTPAEQRVAELAARGLANKEIARALFISVHTVEVHLSRAYAKLGVRSRTQLSGRIPALDKD
jgi:DNA-binding NarL/FixJ family response regulator